MPIVMREATNHAYHEVRQAHKPRSQPYEVGPRQSQQIAASYYREKEAACTQRNKP